MRGVGTSVGRCSWCRMRSITEASSNSAISRKRPPQRDGGRPRLVVSGPDSVQLVSGFTSVDARAGAALASTGLGEFDRHSSGGYDKVEKLSFQPSQSARSEPEGRTACTRWSRGANPGGSPGERLPGRRLITGVASTWRAEGEQRLV